MSMDVVELRAAQYQEAAQREFGENLPTAVATLEEAVSKNLGFREIADLFHFSFLVKPNDQKALEQLAILVGYSRILRSGKI